MLATGILVILMLGIPMNKEYFCNFPCKQQVVNKLWLGHMQHPCLDKLIAIVACNIRRIAALSRVDV